MDHIPLAEEDKAKHEEAINQLCQEFPDKVDFIRSSYLEVLERAVGEAIIFTYLTILISREVRTLLRIQELSPSE
jgi:hypothetical protein